MKWVIFILCLLLAVPVQAHKENSLSPSDLRIDQRLNEQVPDDLVFRDETGQLIRLGDYFGGKPIILVLSYYRCSMLCPTVLEGLVSSLRVLSLNVGDQFSIITVSFDPKDTPEIAAAKKEEYLRRYARPGAAEGWHFLTGEEASIERLTQAVGFHYAYDAKRDQYAHASGIILLTPQGKIARYFFGVEFAPRDLRLGLVEASANKIGSLVDQVMLLCYHYDPTTGKYSATVLNLVRLGGVLTVLALGTFMLVMWRRDRNSASVSYPLPVEDSLQRAKDKGPIPKDK
jgi:protein SCO1/2